MHHDVVPKPNVYTDVKPVNVKVDVRNQFTNEQEFVVCDDMLQWIRTKTSNLGFDVVIGRLDNGLDKNTCILDQ